jgi:hypothetical protein
VERDAYCTSTQLVVETGEGYTLHSHTVGDVKGYTLHFYSVGGGKGTVDRDTPYVHTDYCRQ